MPVPRGQLVARLGQDDGHNRYYTIAGILEVPEGTMEGETSHGFIAASGRTFGGIIASPARQPDPRDLRDWIHVSDLGSLVSHQMWSIPRDGINGGSIFVRKTRMTAREGMEVFAFSGVMRFNGDRIDETCVHEIAPGNRIGLGTTLAGATGFEVVARTPQPELGNTNGMSFASFLKLPVWGWADEPCGFRSTMRLDVIDECDELLDLFDAGETTLTSEQAAWLDAGEAGGIVGTRAVSRNDPEYKRFQEIMLEDGPRLRFDAVLTRSELAREEERAARAVERMHESMGMAP